MFPLKTPFTIFKPPQQSMKFGHKLERITVIKHQIVKINRNSKNETKMQKMCIFPDLKFNEHEKFFEGHLRTQHIVRKPSHNATKPAQKELILY